MSDVELPVVKTPVYTRPGAAGVIATGRIRVRCAAVWAERDQFIPRRHSEKLVAAFDPDIVTTVVVPGADHNTIGLMKTYWDQLTSFFER